VGKERISRISSLLTARFLFIVFPFFFQNVKDPPPLPFFFSFFHMPECLLSRSHCFVSFFLFHFLGGGGERGVQVRVMDSLVLSFGGF